MKRWVPFPLFSLALLAVWLVLNETAAPGQVLLGAALAIGGGRLLAVLQLPQDKVRLRLGAVASLCWLVFVDIARSNLAVLRIVWYPETHGRKAGFLTMPLQVRHPGALVVLACIITATPGTSWARYESTSHTLTIHVLDLIDEEEWIHLFKERYERRLLEIFG
ncbi:MAG: Na+/H+ antiporter subunit E [Betaproteobacteria bacterium]